MGKKRNEEFARMTMKPDKAWTKHEWLNKVEMNVNVNYCEFDL